MAPNTPILISASLKVVERRVLARSTDAKSDATYGVDEWISLLAVDFSTNASNIDVDNVG
jgi:hypothetical protein